MLSTRYNLRTWEINDLLNHKKIKRWIIEREILAMFKFLCILVLFHHLESVFSNFNYVYYFISVRYAKPNIGIFSSAVCSIWCLAFYTAFWRSIFFSDVFLPQCRCLLCRVCMHRWHGFLNFFLSHFSTGAGCVYYEWIRGFVLVSLYIICSLIFIIISNQLRLKIIMELLLCSPIHSYLYGWHSISCQKFIHF